jgi:hypothetical protein
MRVKIFLLALIGIGCAFQSRSYAQPRVGGSAAGLYRGNASGIIPADHLLQFQVSFPSVQSGIQYGISMQWWGMKREISSGRSGNAGSEIQHRTLLYGNTFSLQGFSEWSFGHTGLWKFRAGAGAGVNYSRTGIRVQETSGGEKMPEHHISQQYRPVLCFPVNLEGGRLFTMGSGQGLEVFAGIGSLFYIKSRPELAREQKSPDFALRETAYFVENARAGYSQIKDYSRPYLGVRYFFECRKK